MQVTYSEPCRGDPTREIRAGLASWDTDGTEYSIKEGYRNKLGYIARGSEIPAEVILQMVEVAVRQGYITPKQIAQSLTRVL
jgi:hypothetical protein